jgi:integrase
MASLESRNGSWRVLFYWKNEKKAFLVGEASAAEAAVYKASTEELLRLLKRNLLSVPAGCSIEDFMFHQGKLPDRPTAAAERKELPLADLREAYFKSQEKKLEQTTLDGIRLHFDHLTRILGGKAAVATIQRSDLQRYVDKRSEEWIDPEVYRRKRKEKAALAKPKRKYVRKNAPPKPPEAPPRKKRHPSSATIKKEIISLRTAWNWARRHLGLAEEFPGGGLDYAKVQEALPFMTWEEAERRIAAGDDPEQVWDSVYLRPAEITELLAWVKTRPVSPWVYPIFVFAAHTGARRSEIVRALPSDVDLVNEVITIREKKRDKSRLTLRRIPMTPFLKEVLTAWMQTRAKGRTLFCKADGKEITPREAMNYFDRALRVGKWHVLRGLHVFRHSYISALANRGVDQRIIDELAGHQTEQQRRRYRHLYQQTLTEAAKKIFD